MPADLQEIDLAAALPEIRRARAHVEVALHYAAKLEDRIPDSSRDTIGSALLTAQGELSHLIGDDDGD